MPDKDWVPKPLDILVGYDRSVGEVRRPFRLRKGVPRAITPLSWHPSQNTKFTPNENEYWYSLACRRNGKTWQPIAALERRARINDEQRAYAKRTVKLGIKQGRFEMTQFGDSDKERAEEALVTCVAVMRDRDADGKTKLTAAKILLDFTKQRPTQKQETTIKTAESWLDEIEE